MSRPPNSEGDARAAVESAGALALDLQRRLSDLHHTLAGVTAPGGVLEAELLQLLRDRDDAIVLLGRATLRWLATTDGVLPSDRVAEPAPEAAPEPAPGPVAESAPEPVADPEPGPVAEPEPEPVAEPEPEPEPEPAPVAPAAPPRAVGRPASDASLQALQKQGLGPSWGSRPSPAARRRSLARLLDDLGEPRPVHDDYACEAELTRLTGAAGRMAMWLEQPKDIQRRLVGVVTCRARALQERVVLSVVSDSDTATLNSLFSALSSWSREHEPGYVNGLARDARPRATSWLEEAHQHWETLAAEIGDRAALPSEADEALGELRQHLEGVPEPGQLARLVQQALDAGLAASDPRVVDLLLPYESALHGTSFKTLRKRIRDRTRQEEATEADLDREDPLPSDWRWLAQTRGKRAAIVGGDPRESARKRLQKAFGFAELDWGETNPRRIASLAERVTSRRVDIVIFLARFSGHSMVDHLLPACRAAGARFVNVEHGYGVSQVRRSLERFLADPDDATTAG